MWLSFCFCFYIRYWDRHSFKLKPWVCVTQLLFSVFTGGLPQLYTCGVQRTLQMTIWMLRFIWAIREVHAGCLHKHWTFMHHLCVNHINCKFKALTRVENRILLLLGFFLNIFGESWPNLILSVYRPVLTGAASHQKSVVWWSTLFILCNW